MKKMMKGTMYRMTAFVLAAAVLFGALNFSVPKVNAEVQGPTYGTGHNYTPADVTDNGLTLHKEITGTRGEQATGNLEYDIRLGVKIDPETYTPINPVDVVMVLDSSASMADNFSSSSSKRESIYLPIKPGEIVSNPVNTQENANGTTMYTDSYYTVLRDGNYVKVTYVRGFGSNSTWKVQGREINPSNGGENQFYMHTSVPVYSRLNALKTSANAFADMTEKKSPDSSIGVLTYSSEYTLRGWFTSNAVDNLTNGFLTAGDSKIKQAIQNVNFWGNTQTASALKQAYNQLNKDDIKNDGREKVVILFTDGEPTDSYKDSYTQAQNLKNLGATVFTVGIFDDDTAHLKDNRNNPTIREFMRTMASVKLDKDGNPVYSGGQQVKHYYRADDPDQLTQAFEDILKQISALREIKMEDAKIRDYIDSRFELTEESIRNLESQGATVGKDGKGQYVEWVETLSSKNDMKYYTGITVKPVSQTLSGEGLPTNVKGDSAVYQNTGELRLSFPMPTVEITDVKSALHLDKTAVVHGDDPGDIQNPENPNRRYDIDLNVWTDPIVTSTEPCDIMLILDRSGSMLSPSDEVAASSVADLAKLDKTKQYSMTIMKEVKYFPKEGGWFMYDRGSEESKVPVLPTKEHPVFENKIEVLKRSAIEFVENIATITPNSRIGITLFSSGTGNKVELGFTPVSSKDEIISIINDMDCVYNGLTEMWKALNLAKQQFDKNDSGNREVAVFFTDGVPQAPNNPDISSLSTQTINKAIELKNSGVEIFTVGFCINSKLDVGSYKPSGKPAVRLTPKLLLEYISSDPDSLYSHTAGNTQQLYDSFRQIAVTLVEEVSPVTVRDYIDPRFEVIDPVTGAALKDGDTVGTNGTLRYNSLIKSWYVEWTDQKIPARRKDDQTTSWHQKITVQAVESFFGGNDIPTNLPQISAVYMDEGSVLVSEFPKPTVNVPVRYTVNPGEETIFKGNPVEGKELPKLMFDKANATFTDESGKTVRFNSVDTGVFTFEWFDKDGNSMGSPTYSGAFPQGQRPLEDTDYTLRVTYIPSTPGTSSNGRPVRNTSVENVYQVHVETGSLEIKKQIHNNQTYYIHGDPIFVFCLQKLDDQGNVESSQYRSVRFSQSDPGQNLGQNSEKSALFDGLSAGTYRVIELDTLRYKFERFGDASTNAGLDEQKEWMTFQVGFDNQDGSVLQNGMGTFVNNKVLDRYFTHTDVKENEFTIVPKAD